MAHMESLSIQRIGFTDQGMVNSEYPIRHTRSENHGAISSNQKHLGQITKHPQFSKDASVAHASSPRQTKDEWPWIGSPERSLMQVLPALTKL